MNFCSLFLILSIKLPQLGRAVGQTLKEFKTSTREIMDDVTDEFKLEDSDSEAKTKK